MKLLWLLLDKARVPIALATIAGVMSGALTTGFLVLINRMLYGDAKHPGLSAILFLGLMLVVPCTRAVAELLLVRLGQTALFSLRMELSRLILELPLRKIEEIGLSRILTILTDDLPNINTLITSLPLLSINAAVIVGGLVYMAWLSPELFMIMIFFMIAGVLGYQICVIKAIKVLRLAREEYGQLQSHFQAVVAGIKELKLHKWRRREFIDEALQKSAENLKDLNIKGFSVYSFASAWGQMLVFAVIGTLLFMGGRLGLAGPKELTGFALTLMYIVGPLQMVMNTTPQLGRAKIAAKKVEQFQALLCTYVVKPGIAEPMPGLWDRLELTDVTYTYHDGNEETFTLGPVNARFMPGEMVFIAGGNGSGKSTLAKIISGLYSPDSGHVRLNNKVVDSDCIDDYRQYFSAVFSDFYLFDRIFGLKSVLDEKAADYIERLHLADKLKIERGKFSTVNLSLGQRKRMALLVAYLEDRSVYLFDEWAADQDPEFKQIFYYRLLPQLKAEGKTILVITHDDRYYSVADRLIRMESGRIVMDTREIPKNTELASSLFHHVNEPI